MTEEELLFAAIRANPDEDTPRLAYADWLDEHVGQRTPTPVRPERSTKIPIGTASERAEYIRIECERARLEQGEPSSEVKARLKELRQRSSQLRNSVVKAWEAPFRHGKPFGGRIDGFRFDRGLPKWVILEANEALDYGEALLRQTPVSEFHLNELSGEQLGHLLGAAFLRHLPQLCIDGHHQQLVDLGQFAGSTNTTHLTSLKLYRGWSLTPSGADRLAQSETLPNLRRLLLSGEQFDATGFARLFDGPTFRQLIELHLTVRSCLGVVLENPESHFRRNLGVVPRDREVPFAISLTAPALYEFVH